MSATARKSWSLQRWALPNSDPKSETVESVYAKPLNPKSQAQALHIRRRSRASASEGLLPLSQAQFTTFFLRPTFLPYPPADCQVRYVRCWVGVLAVGAAEHMSGRSQARGGARLKCFFATERTTHDRLTTLLNCPHDPPPLCTHALHGRACFSEVCLPCCSAPGVWQHLRGRREVALALGFNPSASD